jgi:hypothetical protein
MPKAVQERFFQESCARMFFCQIDVKSCAKEILSRELRKSVLFCQRDVQGCTRFIVVLTVAQKRDSHIFVSSEHF